MPKRLRYTQVLGLNSRGLTRHQKRQIVWKEHVKDKLPRSMYVKPITQKRKNRNNDYWDKYHDELQKFDNIGLKDFLNNPNIINKIQLKKRKIIYSKLQNAQLRIECLKHKYSVSVPDSKSIKLISILSKGQGIIQVKTSNHQNGYWLHLLKQKNINSKLFKIINPNNSDKNIKNIKNTKSKAKQWINVNQISSIENVFRDYSKFVLLMIYPDFMMDQNIVNKIDNNNNNNENEIKNDKFESYGSLIRNNKLSIECLKHFRGNYVIHIGELFGCTFDSMNPFGRTTSQKFQIELQKHFHKIYQHEMCRWPLFRDTLTVWKRNQIINIGNQAIISLQNIEMNDNLNTKYWKNLFKQRINKKDGSNKNIFDGSNYANKSNKK